MSELALSRTLDPADYEQLKPELQGVDCYDLSGQHPHRRWEYGLALHAVRGWQLRSGREIRTPLYDVGGAGSPFSHMLASWTACQVLVIDPKITRSLEQVVVEGTRLADVVTCISVIEHVEDEDQFLYHLSCLVAPGGLLVLTMDFWNRCGPDRAENRDLRKRIYCPKSYLALRNRAVTYHLTPFGGVDPHYHGAYVHDYSFASLVLEKRR